jgi:hypothetical protein
MEYGGILEDRPSCDLGCVAEDRSTVEELVMIHPLWKISGKDCIASRGRRIFEMVMI